MSRPRWNPHRRVFCQRCERSDRGIRNQPPVGLCDRCFFTMPDDEFKEMVENWLEMGIIPNREGPWA